MRSPGSWKEAGWDDSPPRSEPTPEARLEMLVGQRTLALQRMQGEGRAVFDYPCMCWRTRGAVIFDHHLADDVAFATFMLAAGAVK